ncbi:hypothetical protein BCR39DRAFT_515505 [Naematelia encephala]|uniref:Glutathione reductase n=1 Tax=Naematelia encephala TaxID=71784 RepID=A0A1Y2BJH0_9TREE|nr:hypothetical protein BCR39DRAFT_515505 [Naematelia encephala]
MPPLDKHKAEEIGEYDYFVIGGGSGGLASARRAAQYGAKVGLVEATHRLGGTCVNVGCVPKKIMWYTADIAENIRKAVSYGFGDEKIAEQMTAKYDWTTLKHKRDAYIKRLNGIYERNLVNDKVDYHEGFASFVDANTLEITGLDGEKYKVKAKNICVAVGGRPTKPSEDTIPGANYGIDSDGFFDIEEQPKTVVVVGAGYIAVELAGVFNTLGTETHLVIRHEKVLRTFDPLIQDTLTPYMEKTGLNVHKTSNVKKVEKTASGRLSVHIDSLDKPIEADVLLWAIGRHANTEKIAADKAGLKLDDKGRISVDDYQNTNVPHIFSIGDVTGKVELTPVAIAAGRRLSNRLFGPDKFKDDKLSYDNIPSVVFSHPTIGAIGLTEPQAREKFGDKVTIYKTSFKSMSFAMMEEEHKQPTAYKLVCVGDEEKVVGVHIIGEGSDEMLQGFGVAVKMGATKSDFDSCVAIRELSSVEV